MYMSLYLFDITFRNIHNPVKTKRSYVTAPDIREAARLALIHAKENSLEVEVIQKADKILNLK